MSIIQEALVFLIGTFINLYFMMVLVRLIFQYLKIDFYNPFSQFILKITNPILIPMQRYIPSYSQINLAALLLLLALKFSQLLLTTLISTGHLPSVLALLIWPIAEILSQTINFFLIAIVLAAAFSWFTPRSHSPLTTILSQITEPLITPVKGFLPPIAGIDLSPVLVLIGLKLLDILLVHSIMTWLIRVPH